MYFYQSGIDETFQPNLSPGLLNHLLLIKSCQDKELSAYNLLNSANINDYKSTMSQQGLAVFTIRMLPPTYLNKCRHSLERITPFIKYIIQKIKNKIENPLNSNNKKVPVGTKK